MKIALVLYPGFTALDITGPFQVLADVPGHDTMFVAEQPGAVTDHTGRFSLIANLGYDDIPDPDIVVVPGALADRRPDLRTTEWLRQVHPTTQCTTSVCTGSTYLAAAGILDHVGDATCHWARSHRLEEYGVSYTPRRIVRHGRVVTAAGVSAGIDMGLHLLEAMYGAGVAQSVQLAIEYDPEPPHDCGSPAKADPELTQMVHAALNATLPEVKE